MKKIILILCIFLLTACAKENKTYNGKLIATSNSISESKLQIKITNDYINIRKDQSVSSDIVGIVMKDSVFDVIDYEKDGKYCWVHIKSDNELEGYVASFEDNIYYEFINGDIDFINPKLEISVDSVDVSSFSEITDDYINSICIYSDDKDDNPKITYKVKTQGSINYLDIEVVDYSNNKVNKSVKLNVKNEKLASNGKWVTYDEVRELRKKFLNIIRKYGQTEEYTYVTSNYWKIQFGSSSTIAVFSDLGWYNGCYYEAIGEEIKVSECNDSAGTIPYEDYKSKIASQEEHAKQAYLNISKEFAKTDYKISDLFLGF